jgi:hypothetical protein
VKISHRAIAALIALGAGSAEVSMAEEHERKQFDPALCGVWIPETYVYGGRPYKMIDALMVITPQYLIANAIYDLSEKKKKPKPDANANFGPYRITRPGELVMDQKMQLHWRSEGEGVALVEGDGTFFNQNVPETILYEVHGDTLTFSFQVPGEQSWIMKRVPGEMTCQG